MVLVEAGHVVVREAVTAREGQEPVPALAEESLPERSDPQVPVAVLPDGASRVGREAVSAGEDGDGAILDLREAAPGAHPDRSRAVLEDEVHEAVGQGLARAVADQASCLQHGQSLGGAEPEVPPAVLVDGGDGVPGGDGLLVFDAPPLPEPPEAAPARPDPQAAVGALVERANVLERAVAGLGGRLEGSDDPVLHAGHPSRRGPDPEGAVAGGAQRQDASVPQARGVAGVEDGETDTVETNEPAQAPDPEISVASLGDGLDELLGQAVTGEPDVVPVTAGRAHRVEGEQRRRPTKRQPDAGGPDSEEGRKPAHALTTARRA